MERFLLCSKRRTKTNPLDFEHYAFGIVPLIVTVPSVTGT